MLATLAPDRTPDPRRRLRGEPANSTFVEPCRFLEFHPDPAAGLIASVAKALRSSGYHSLRDVTVEVENGVLLLWGRVPSYHEKQLAQAIAQRVEGVRGIANGLEVVCVR